jgi:hypothetical protein
MQRNNRSIYCSLVHRCTPPYLPLPRSLQSIRHSMCKCYHSRCTGPSYLYGLGSIVHAGLASSVEKYNAAGEQMDPTMLENRINGLPWGSFLRSSCQVRSKGTNVLANQTALAATCQSYSIQAGPHPTLGSASLDLCAAS